MPETAASDAPKRSNPYAPPGAAGGEGGGRAAVAGGTGGSLVVDASARLPRVCLKCAATRGIVRRHERFAVSSVGKGIGMGGGVVGVMVANVARNARELLLPVLAVVALAVAGLAWAIQRTSTKAELDLPLCEPCDARWQRGVDARTKLLAGLGAAALLIVSGMAAETPALTVVGGVALAVGIAVAVALKLPARFVTASRIEGRYVTLANVSPAAVDLVLAGGPPRKKRNKKESAQA